ncbi:MAG TPA: pitrilysin family protein [Pyrinomonadaceae bacterium]
MTAIKIFGRAILTTFLVAIVLSFAATPTFAQQETPPPPAAPRSPVLPVPVEKVMTNGLRVIVVERTTAKGGMPLVSAQLFIKNGGEVDPSNLSGLANLTAALLTEGTATRTAPQIAQAIEALGGSLDARARWDASSVNLTIMSSKLTPALAILADVVRHPAFKDEEIERQRQQLLDQLSVALRQPGALANAVASRVLFGETPYGHLLTGTPETIKRITRDDIVKFHATYYRPDNAVLVIGGDIKAADAFKLAEKLFGDWQKTPGMIPTVNTSAREAITKFKPRVLVIDKPDAGQAAVLLVRPGLPRKDPDYFRAVVTNAVLSGFSGRLNQEIRIKRGLSYGARSVLETRRDIGPFIASAQTKNQTGAEVASLLMSELKRLSDEPVNDTELTPRKATLIGGFGSSLETNAGLVGQVAALALNNLNLDEINHYIANVQGVTAGDIQKFAGARLGTDASSIVIVGNASAFLDSLRKQFPNVEVIREADLDLNSPTLRKSGGDSSQMKP